MIAILHSSHECEKLSMVVSILKRQRIPYKVYGVGQRYRGNREKIVTFAKAAFEHRDEHLLIIDAWDVVCLRGVADIVDRFKQFEHPWVASAEMACWPDAELARSYPPSPTPYRYLNSGGFMVKREVAKKFFARTLVTDLFKLSGFSFSDQHWWHCIHLTHPGLLKLDVHCQLFHSLYPPEPKLEMSLWQARNPATNSHPLVIHSNNNGDISQLRGKLWE